MKNIRKAVVIILCTALMAQAQGNTFKVRYNGGSVASKVNPKDWGNKLTINADMISLQLKGKGGGKVDIAPKSVTSISYGQEAHRRVGTYVALAILISPVALFGLFSKTRLHYIGIQYTTPEVTNAGVLLQGDKDNYRAILVALQGVTHVPVSVSDKDREFVPVGTTTAVVKDEESKPSEKAASEPTGSTATGSIAVTSEPNGSEVYADGAFVGNCPATLKLSPGKHSIKVSKTGYKDWNRDITVQSGSSVNLTATLEQ
jgi:hypothetical protein